MGKLVIAMYRLRPIQQHYVCSENTRYSKIRWDKIYLLMQPWMVEMIWCTKYMVYATVITDNNKHQNHKLRSLKLLRNAVYATIMVQNHVLSEYSFAKWKLIQVCRPQNHLTMGHFNKWINGSTTTTAVAAATIIVVVGLCFCVRWL